jgi:gamma-glutamyltranspeptidase/glutathione hydrolase
MAIGSGWPSALHKVAALGFQRAGISPHDEGFTRGTTSIQAADAEGWVVSVTPSMALQDGIPLMAFSVQGGDTQDQNLLQFSLNMVEFGMNVQEAAEAPNFTSYQMQNSFGAHGSQPGHVDVKRNLAPYSQSELEHGLRSKARRPYLQPDHRHLV